MAYRPAANEESVFYPMLPTSPRPIMRLVVQIIAVTALFAALWPAPAKAQRAVPSSRADIARSFAPVVKRAAPAVVNVYVRRRVKQRGSPFFNDPFFRQFMGRGFGIPRDRVQNSLGSGVIVSAEGIVVTNNHVIKGRGEAEIKVVLADKREFNAKLALEDERTDLAILRIQGTEERFPFLQFEDSDALEVGDLVLAIGNPFGVGQTVTSGIVSALARTRVGISDYQFFIQTDAAINPGNSGGALVDINGNLVGINTAIYSRSGGSIGIGFAIPSNMVRLVVDSGRKGGQVKRPWLGATLQPVTPDIADSLGLERPTGALVKQVFEDGPADRAGLEVGDVIVSVSDKTIEDPRAFRYRFTTRGIGGSVAVAALRQGKRLDASIALVAAPEDPPRDIRKLTGRHPFAGAEIGNLSPALAEELSLDEDAFGVVVMTVARSSAALRYGVVRPGDIIVAVNDTKIETTRQLQQLMSKRARFWRVAIKRGQRILNLRIGG